MEDNNKNMEEFMRKAMEGFNESPSDKIWEGLDNRLTESEPFYKKFLHWRFLALVSVLALLLSSNIYLYNKSNSLESTLNQISERSKIDGTKESISAINSVLTEEQSMNEIIQENDLDASLSNTISAGIRKDSKLNQAGLFKGSINSNELNSNFNTGTGTRFYSNTNSNQSILAKEYDGGQIVQGYEKSLNKSRSNVSPLQDTTGEMNQSDNEFGATLREREVLELSKSATQDIVALEQVKTAVQTSAVGPGIGLQIHTVDILETKNKADKLKNLFSDWKLPDINVKRIPMIDKSGRFLFGLNIGTFFSHINSKFHSIPNGNAGINIEYQINPKFSVISSVKYNYQQYQIKNPSIQDLDKFPGSESLDNVKEVEVRNNYIDASLGLIFKKEYKPKNRLFVAPALAWQFYFPQTFDYTLAGGSSLPAPPPLEVKSHRFFGYFGMVNINLGFEKDLGAMSTYRLGLFIEKSLISLGIEDADVTQFGIRSTFLFGGTL